VTQLDPAIIQKYFPPQPTAKPVVGKKAAPVPAH